MKPKQFIHVLIFTWLFCAGQSTLSAHDSPRSTGIGLRVSYWSLPEPNNYVAATFPYGTSKIDVGGPGGWFYILKRVNDNMLVELSIGGVGAVKGETSDPSDYDGYFNHHHHDDDDLQNLSITTITPALFGLRFGLLSASSRAGFQPYVSGGIGPYFIADITVLNDGFIHETTCSWQTQAGGYFGAGADLYLNSWLALNVDAKYHMLDFDVNNEYSNMEWGLGLQFMWGKWR